MLLHPDDEQYFIKDYRRYVENSVKEKLKGYENIVFNGWLNGVFLAVLDEGVQLFFIFGNIKSKNRFYSLKTYRNNAGYKYFHLDDLKSFPKEFFKVLKKRGLLFNGDYGRSKITTVQRLIACLTYDITSSHIHHIDYDIDNNYLDNLIPLNPLLHQDLHSLNSEKIDRVNKPEKLKKKTKYSKYKNDLIILVIIYYKYIEGYTINHISRFKAVKPLSTRTINNILKNFAEFKSYYFYITGRNGNNCTF